MTSDTARPAVAPTTSARLKAVPVQPVRGRLQPVPLDDVAIAGGFWGERQERNAVATLAHIEHWLEREGWLANFDAVAAGTVATTRRGREFSDSETYKLLEAMAWELARRPDPDLGRRFDAIVRRVAAAQQADGYLSTAFGSEGQAPRWSDLEWGHELYCIGHLVQAAVARARTAPADVLVTVACRAADLVCEVFGENGIRSVCGHPEIEPALVELYRVTGERRYLDQARLFVERRGHQVLQDIEFGRSYFQDDVPFRDATALRGHAVRAVYLASGAVDLAVEDDDETLLKAAADQLDAALERRTYVTGGMGSRHQDEAFGDDFVLPNDRAYSETCAGVGAVMLGWRLLLADGRSDRADLIERILYNVVATSPGPQGTSFYYTNTLHQRQLTTVPATDEAVPRAASSMRAPWFSVSCCPTNVARTFASLAAYVATTDDDGLQLHQYVPATIATTLPDGRRVGVEVETDYPRQGVVGVVVTEATEGEWTLTLRVPSWAAGATLTVDGRRTEVAPGTVEVRRVFGKGDRVRLELPMVPVFVRADRRVDGARGCVAVQRGPEVLCLESVDLPAGTHVDDIIVDATVPPMERDGTVTVLGRVLPDARRTGWPYRAAGDGAAAEGLTADLRLVAYHDWAHRGPSTMRVWLPTA